MKRISEALLYKGNWLSLKESVFINSSEEAITWESIERSNNSCAFGIIARLVPSNRYILIKQFRQAINNSVVGLPAGIVNSSISDEKQKDSYILRELKEETGYTGVVTFKSPMLKLNPALMNSDFFVVSVEIDERNPENGNIKQRLEPAEEIEVVLLKEDRIKDFLLEQIEMGTDIASGVWYLMNGLN